MRAGLDQETQNLLDELARRLSAPPRADLPPIESARRTAQEIFCDFAGPAPQAAVAVDSVRLPGGDGYRPARLYRRDGTAPGALILFLHGGGWMYGSPEDYDGLIARLCGATGFAFVSLDYRLAPEHPYPAGLADARAALRHLIEQASRYDVEPTQIGVMGDSAGGNLAAVLALDALRGGPKPAAQFLLYPMLDVSRPHFFYPSRLAFGGGDLFLTCAAIDAAAAAYLPDPALAHDPQVSPLRCREVVGVAPAYIVVGEFDPLRDEAALYAKLLEEHGVDVEYDCVSGAVHAMLSFGTLRRAQVMEARLTNSLLRLML